MNWFTADFHLSHKNIIKYCDRSFKSVEEMNATILDNLFKRVNRGDTLYFLGDLTFDKKIATNFFNVLRDIEIHFIIGNHDSSQVIKIAQELVCLSLSYKEY